MATGYWKVTGMKSDMPPDASSSSCWYLPHRFQPVDLLARIPHQRNQLRVRNGLDIKDQVFYHVIFHRSPLGRRIYLCIMIK